MTRCSTVSVGERWRNRHTAETTTILAIKQVRRKRPTGVSQAIDGRFVFRGNEAYVATMVRFDGGAPPGFDQRRFGGWEIEIFLRHWERLA